MIAFPPQDEVRDPRQVLARSTMPKTGIGQTDNTQRQVLARPSRLWPPLARLNRLWTPLARLTRHCPDHWADRTDLRPDRCPDHRPDRCPDQGPDRTDLRPDHCPDRRPDHPADRCPDHWPDRTDPRPDY